MVLLLTVYWKADLALFRRPDLEKVNNKEQIWHGPFDGKAVIQSWNFADFDLYISEGMGLPQWTIIMPLIQSPVISSWIVAIILERVRLSATLKLLNMC